MRPTKNVRRCFLLLVAIACSMASFLAASPARGASGLVKNMEAERVGLVRAWFSQAELDRTRHRVERAIFDGNQLFVLTTAGVLHAMDAETGSTHWVARIGNPAYPSLGPAVSDKYVSLVNGSTLVVLDRENGLEVMSRKLSGGAGGGPAINDKYVYVPMFTGKLEAYALDDEKADTWYYASAGRVFDSPVATEESIIWPTDRGYLYVANPAANGVRYRFESSGRVIGDPAAYDGTLYATSSNGYLYALNEGNGQQQWRYSTGGPIIQPPLLVAGTAYVATVEPTLHAVGAKSGDLQWSTPGVSQVASVSKSRVYGMNRLGDLLAIDGKSGVPLGSVRTSVETQAVANADNDRVYLVSETGLVQCLHELGAEEPHLHAEAAPADEAQKPSAEETPPAEDDQPAAAEGEPAEPAKPNPFDVPAADDNPFDLGGDDDSNPFGF